VGERVEIGAEIPNVAISSSPSLIYGRAYTLEIGMYRGTLT
jgi:hypothetical protein